METVPEAYQKVMQTVFRILSYRDNTEKTLRRKLAEKKYSEEEINFALRYAVQNGYLNEERHLASAVEQMARVRHFGRRRILQELYRLGFSREALAHGVENGCFDGIDFVQNCADLLRRRGGVLDQKNYAFLLRYGYTAGEIGSAQKMVDKTQ